MAEDFLSRRQYDIRFKNLADGSWADEVLENTSGSFEWANDSSTVYYVRKHARRCCRIRSIVTWWAAIRSRTS